jgi:CubicO group peptidase (beta-lactamase class C family)
MRGKMTRWRERWVAVAALSVVVTSAVAGAHARRLSQTSAPRPEIDRIYAAWARPDSPGCSVAIYKGGRIDYARGYGLASLEHDLPITPDSVFYVGSLSKQFTAMAAALAIQQGRLGLDDPIRKHLPELPDYATRITVRHLIHHTSGLRDYNTLLSIAGRRGDAAFDNATVLRIAARQKQLNFEPGSEYLYSNTGYTLLATIVERATGTPFADFAARQIFEPLGMHVSHFHVDETRTVKGRAFAFSRQGGSFGLDTPSNERAGAGGLFTNVRDLLHWDENFYTARVGGRALIAQLQTPGTLDDGSRLNYAWGLQIGTYRGLPAVEHGGSLGGYRAHLLRFPDQHVSVAALCNLGDIVPGTLARATADVALGGRFTEAKPKPAAQPGTGGGRGGRGGNTRTPESLADAPSCTGSYYSDEIDTTFVVTARDGVLWLRRDADAEPSALQPLSTDVFRYRGMTVRFERGAGPHAASLVVDAGRVRGIRFVRSPM